MPSPQGELGGKRSWVLGYWLGNTNVKVSFYASVFLLPNCHSLLSSVVVNPTTKSHLGRKALVSAYSCILLLRDVRSGT